MALRVTPTVVICAIGAAVTGALLAWPPADSAEPAVPPPVAPAGSAAPAAPAESAAIAIADFSFGESRTVGAGAAVQVTNADAAAHTLTAKGGAFDTGSVDQGVTTSFTAPAAPGTYEFFCEIHPSMTGLLVVN
jgi:plastocyanin